MNHLADRSPKELAILRGRTHTDGYNGGLPFHPDLAAVKDVPDTLDWRLCGKNIFMFCIHTVQMACVIP